MHRFASASPGFLGLMAGLFLIGLLLGAVHRDFGQQGKTGKLAKLAGVALASAAGFLAVAALAKPSRTLAWQPVTVEQARAVALQEQRPLLVDFTASWCVACKELDKITFADDAVAAEAGRFVAVKVDATNDDDPEVEATLAKFSVVGLPTVLVFDSTGKEALRYTDFVQPQQFLSEIRTVP
jgi:thiol:disulfide interchange protein DsbD